MILVQVEGWSSTLDCKWTLYYDGQIHLVL